jgi:excisionase family DNA binding protein
VTTATRGTYDVPKACELIGIHKLSGYKAIREGTFPVPVIKVGRRYVVPKAALDRLLAGEAET